MVSSTIDEKLELSSRNVPHIMLVKAKSCSVRDLYDNDIILIDKDGLEEISKRFEAKN